MTTTLCITLPKNNKSNSEKSLTLVPPKRYKKIDDKFSRSGQPENKIEYLWLKKNGYTDVFSLNSKTADKEKTIVNSLGMKYHGYHLTSRTPNECVIENCFKDIVSVTEKEGTKTLLHCVAGEDRTGAISFLYRLFKKAPLKESFEELLKMGYKMNLFPNLIKAVVNIYNKNNPNNFLLSEDILNAGKPKNTWNKIIIISKEAFKDLKNY